MTTVGDVIERGQQIPPDVVAFTDRHGESGAEWRRLSTDPLRYAYSDPVFAPTSPPKGWPAERLTSERDGWFPLTVTEVDS